MHSCAAAPDRHGPRTTRSSGARERGLPAASALARCRAIRIGRLPQFVQGPCPIADLRRYARARGLSVGGLMGRPRRARSTVGKTLCVRVGCSGIRCTEVTRYRWVNPFLPQEHSSVSTLVRSLLGEVFRAQREARGRRRPSPGPPHTGYGIYGFIRQLTQPSHRLRHTRVTCVDSTQYRLLVHAHHLASSGNTLSSSRSVAIISNDCGSYLNLSI